MSAKVMNDDKTNALTDMAYYNGARYALIALGGGMDRKDLDAELEARVAPARRWLAENRRTKASPTPPYPWCRQPSVCRGTCPMDPSCGE